MTLDEASRVHPDTNWWIKADGVDVVSGLEESMRLEWHGDIDLADGKLQRQYQAYRDRLKFVGGICRNLLNATQRHQTVLDLKRAIQDMVDDLTFVSSGMYTLS